MLFQTLVQLNILILATPALAGWSLLPPVHGVTGCVVGIVWHRTAQMPAPKAAVSDTRLATRAAVVARLPLPALVPVAAGVPAPRPMFASFSIPPHAARAP